MRESRRVYVGKVPVGGGAPVSVQSMLNVPCTDLAGNVRQAQALAQAGCQILRVAVPNMDAVALIPAIKQGSALPLVADIHFDYRLALAAAQAGADAVRINPGNIGGQARVRAVVDKCRERHLPIRVGVNSGSLEKDLLEKYGGPTPQALADSAMRHVRILEDCGFADIVVSIKSSRVDTMIRANELCARACSYPLHLGVTEAGTERMGLIQSSIGIGSLLQRGIGDTIRVSLTADPVREVYAAQDLLHALDMGAPRPRIVSCPTCGRTRVDLIRIAQEVEERLRDCHKPITVAVMGCAVNGPGEAREADVGIAGGDGEGLLFKKGKILRKLPEDKLVDALMDEIERI